MNLYNHILLNEALGIQPALDRPDLDRGTMGSFRVHLVVLFKVPSRQFPSPQK